MFCLMCIHYITCVRRSEFIDALNEMFRYNEIIGDWLKENDIQPDQQHKQMMRRNELVTGFASVFSYMMGSFVMIALLHPIEPTHVIIQEWFELDLELKPTMLPALFVLAQMIQGCANTIIIYALLAMPYVTFATPLLHDLSIVGCHKTDNRKQVLETYFFENLEDSEICRM